MASYTDKIPQFNPYVQELPIQAMVEVGMEKQRRYDEGIQKIQTSINNVAGLDIANETQKVYLQSTLNKLGSKLKTFAASDFSNYQLVNSVSGMTNQIIKDPVIQNAVASTARYKKGIADREAYKKEGKDSPSNDFIFNRSASEFLNSKDVNAQFSASYDPYTNWKKNSLEVIKALTGNKNITEDAFTTDAKGNLVIADAIIRKEMSGISPEQIQQALLSALSPADFKQMQIDSIYNYSNQNADQFKLSVNNSYTDKLQGYSDEITNLQNSKLSTTSNVEKQNIDKKIASLSKMVTNLTKEQTNLIGMIDSNNLDGAKAQFGTFNSINGIARAFSSLQTSQTYESNPLADMALRREIKDQEHQEWLDKFNQDERFHSENLEQSKEANRLKRLETEGYGALPGEVEQADPKVVLADVVTSIDSGQKELNTYKNQFLKQQGKDQKWLDQQQLAWEKNPNGVDATVSKYFNAVADKQRTIDANQIMLSGINKEADEKFGTIDKFIPKGAPNLVLTTASGAREVYTPKDFVEFNQMSNRYLKTRPSERMTTQGGPVMETVWDDNLAKAELTTKMYRLYQAYKTGNRNTGGDKVLYDNILNYAKTVNAPYQKVIKERNDFTAEQVATRLTGSQGAYYPIPTASAEQKNGIANLLTAYASRADKQKGGVGLSPEWNSETARALALDPEAKFNIKLVEGTEARPGKYEIVGTGNAGTIRFNVTPQEKIAVFGDRFEASPAVRMIRPYQEQINKTGGYTTANDGVQYTTPSNGWLNNTDFPNVQSYGVKANLINSSGQYQIRLAIWDPIEGKWNNDIPFPRNKFISEEGVAPALITMSDAAIYELLNDVPPSATELQKLKQANKKPL
jgi:hypothetical protein